MKAFVVTDSPAGVFISKTQGKSFPRHAIVGEFDTYKEAATLRDKLREQIAEAKSRRAEQWHEDYENAQAHGDIARVNKLCGIR